MQLLDAPALASHRVPLLAGWASLEDWAHAAAFLEAEKEWRHALDGLLALTLASQGVPDPRPYTRGSDLFDLPARPRLKDHWAYFQLLRLRKGVKLSKLLGLFGLGQFKFGCFLKLCGADGTH
jgi:hypothetical protein